MKYKQSMLMSRVQAFEKYMANVVTIAALEAEQANLKKIIFMTVLPPAIPASLKTAFRKTPAAYSARQ
jgi:predicted metal-dependent TIM-barrel fold hydrolase